MCSCTAWVCNDWPHPAGQWGLRGCYYFLCWVPWRSSRARLLCITMSVTTSTGVFSYCYYCKIYDLRGHKGLSVCVFTGGNPQQVFFCFFFKCSLHRPGLKLYDSIKALVFLIPTQAFTRHVRVSVYLFSPVPSSKVVKEQTEQDMRNNNNSLCCLSVKENMCAGSEYDHE